MDTKPSWPRHTTLSIAAGLAALFAGALFFSAPAEAADTNQQAPAVRSQADDTYNEQEIVSSAGKVFGGTAKGLADAIHSVFKKYGEPNAYIQGEEAKVFTLVYNLPNGETIYQRFPGVEGSAYLVAGIGVNYQQRDNVVLAPMRSGVGLRLGASVGYLKYTKDREWLPF